MFVISRFRFLFVVFFSEELLRIIAMKESVYLSLSRVSLYEIKQDTFHF